MWFVTQRMTATHDASLGWSPSTDITICLEIAKGLSRFDE
jgi:hypothetical protein